MTHSFPTRRSSDLRTRLQQQARQRGTSLLAGRQQAATAQACARRQLHVPQRRIDADGRRGIDATPEPQILDRTELQVETIAMAEPVRQRSEEHTSELQSLMRISYAVFCLKKTKDYIHIHKNHEYKRTYV